MIIDSHLQKPFNSYYKVPEFTAGMIVVNQQAVVSAQYVCGFEQSECIMVYLCLSVL